MAINGGYFGMPLNMDRVCRICLTENTNLSPIFTNQQEVDSLSDLHRKIQICGSIDVHEQDGLPSVICDICIYKASVAHEFRQLCQHSDARLRMYYNKPAKFNATDSGTQTDFQTEFVLMKKTPELHNNYFVKDEVIVQQFPMSNEEYAQSTPGTVAIDENTDSSITVVDEKLYIQNLAFVSEKDVPKDSVVISCSEHIICDDNIISVSNNMMTDVCNVEDKTLSTVEVQSRNPEDYFNYIENDSVDEENLEKRISNRKIKEVQEKISFDEEDDDINNYFEPVDSDSEEESKFKCKVCSKPYATEKGLKKHSIIHEKQHKCNICHKMFFKTANLEKHKEIHTTKPHACQLCHSSFSKSQTLVKHLKSHTEKVNDIIKQIKSEDDSDNGTGNGNEPDGFENAPELYKCEVCSQYCSTLKNLKRHALIHGEKKYSCTVCKKWFFRPDTLKKHAEKHGHGLLDNLADDNKLYDSDDEPFSNSTSNAMAENDNSKKEESDEEGTGEYKCQHCDKVMATKKGLRRHVATHKPKSEPVVCEVCKKVCASQARLILHQKTHNKPKEKVPREYLCHICSKVYPSNSSLTYHMRTHTGVKPHVCKTCNSGFTTTTSLANHIRIHTGDRPFVCHVCSAAFAVSSAFRRHLTRHTGEANYLCKTCGKAFKRLSTLKEHTYTHSGEKPYVCKTCSAAYSHSGSLFAHQKRCRAQYSDIVVDDHHSAAHHIHVNNVQSGVRSLTVIGQMF